MNSRFTLVGRWLFPDSCGAVTLHNGYLIKEISATFNCNIISYKSDINRVHYYKNGIELNGIEIPFFI